MCRSSPLLQRRVSGQADATVDGGGGGNTPGAGERVTPRTCWVRTAGVAPAQATWPGWSTPVELASVIFEYLEIFHNRQRHDMSLVLLTPVEFEAQHQPTTAA